MPSMIISAGKTMPSMSIIFFILPEYLSKDKRRPPEVVILYFCTC